MFNYAFIASCDIKWSAFASVNLLYGKVLFIYCVAKFCKVLLFQGRAVENFQFKNIEITLYLSLEWLIVAKFIRSLITDFQMIANSF